MGPKQSLDECTTAKKLIHFFPAGWCRLFSSFSCIPDGISKWELISFSHDPIWLKKSWWMMSTRDGSYLKFLRHLGHHLQPLVSIEREVLGPGWHFRINFHRLLVGHRHHVILLLEGVVSNILSHHVWNDLTSNISCSVCRNFLASCYTSSNVCKRWVLSKGGPVL